jgi:hypothetical protein
MSPTTSCIIGVTSLSKPYKMNRRASSLRPLGQPLKPAPCESLFRTIHFAKQINVCMYVRGCLFRSNRNKGSCFGMWRHSHIKVKMVVTHHNIQSFLSSAKQSARTKSDKHVLSEQVERSHNCGRCTGASPIREPRKGWLCFSSASNKSLLCKFYHRSVFSRQCSGVILSSAITGKIRGQSVLDVSRQRIDLIFSGRNVFDPGEWMG